MRTRILSRRGNLSGPDSTGRIAEPLRFRQPPCEGSAKRYGKISGVRLKSYGWERVGAELGAERSVDTVFGFYCYFLLCLLLAVKTRSLLLRRNDLRDWLGRRKTSRNFILLCLSSSSRVLAFPSTISAPIRFLLCIPAFCFQLSSS